MHLYSFDDFRLGAGRGDGRLAEITDLVDETVAHDRRMATLIAVWDELRPAVESAIAAGPQLDVADVTLRAPLPAPGTLAAAPVNYKRHQDEMGGEGGVYDGEVIKTIETYAGFVKASSSIAGPDERILLPFDDRRFDHEAEIGVVIGSTASSVPRERAMDHVFGYVPLLDITMRGQEDRSYRKSFDTFTPIGPAIVTADEVADHADIAFELTVNGELRQRANTCDLIYDIPRLVELYSTAMTLSPGDLIATGTPEGVGEIRPGDEVVLTIDGIGQLTMQTAARAALATGRVA
ncbi:fumarylacetoacetate hydrolase family protein [Conexibacter stalactiti]|uniref:Fumarylacetoacetate hydrolase family protein n=1 Tax=Conexibacter stalactiti TaxID=1940611 RepID=A0ABU4HLI6_9ACTN|nr:fumarylacetoacetate hydrolase family protein [Conexibacter stalactiti]MDW5593435.1 fumarylacetoacetate hydrolase family protein [Conexibacter stalactiti]MEC5034076.1 fumarylacetoacetate hydrolase family protein [Conexibacter stalactiti]